MKPLLDLNVTIRDAEILAHVRQEDEVRYLAAHGWRKAMDLEYGCELWRKGEEGVDWAEVFTTSPRVADHANRVGDFIETVCAMDGVPPLRLLVELVPGLSIG